MPIPTSGPLTLAQIQTEFGGVNPIGINEYYAGGGLVPSGTSGINGPVPSSGTISFSIFYGTNAALPFGAVQYTAAGTYTFVVPAGYTSISAVCVGAGGLGGGALSYTNGIATTPGESLTVVVGAGVPFDDISGLIANGGPSSISRGGTVLLSAAGGLRLSGNAGGQASAGVGAVRFSGGSGNGSGAAGYSGNGGNGVAVANTVGNAGQGGGGGSGGRGSTASTAGGGGVGLVVQGSSGAGGGFSTTIGFGGGGGSGGQNGTATNDAVFENRRAGGNSGGGGGRFDGVDDDSFGRTGVGGVRIIFGGTNKNYPFNSAP